MDKLSIGTIIVAALGYLGIRRANSGNVSTSTAGELWEASQDIRKELREDVRELKKRVKELEECCEKKRRAKVG